jgi:hypothetical protein
MGVQGRAETLTAAMDEETPRQLAERTGRHYCIRCLAEVASDEYFANDFFCDRCAEEAGATAETMNDER